MGYTDFFKEMAKRVLPPPARYFIRQIFNYRLRGLSSAQYWTRHNVTEHRAFASAEESLRYFDWRNAQYIGYIDLMPVDRAEGKIVLDYGCGPGNDLVGFGVRSRPARLIGVDVSLTSLAEAKARLAIHGIKIADFVLLKDAFGPLPFESRSIDLIHSAGVLHHLSNMKHALREFRRILRDDGHCQIMVYNYNSIWMQLYASYIYKKMHPWMGRLSKQEVFKLTTDGEQCPIVNCFTPDQFSAIAAETGFRAEFLGAAVALTEMMWLPRRYEAIKDQGLDPESRDFLLGLTFDDRNIPLHCGDVAGINGCFRLIPT